MSRNSVASICVILSIAAFFFFTPIVSLHLMIIALMIRLAPKQKVKKPGDEEEPKKVSATFWVFKSWVKMSVIALVITIFLKLMH